MRVRSEQIVVQSESAYFQPVKMQIKVPKCVFEQNEI